MDKKNAKLISILGSNDYTTVNYDDFEECEYIQEALVKKYQDKLSEVIIFATEEVIKKNWKSGAKYYITDEKAGINKGDPRKGLKKKLNIIKKENNLDLDLKMFKIPKGFTEKELWKIFNIFINSINEGDEIYFDVTHGFRHLSMLVMNILNYAKLSKNIEVKSIEYGLFDELGRASDVRAMDLENRNASILDLTSFDYLNDWVIGIDNFINTGDAEKINNLPQKTLVNLFIDQNFSNDVEYNFYNKLKKLKKKISTFNNEVKTTRGIKLNDTIINILNEIKEINLLKDKIEEEKDLNDRILPFIKLIDNIEDKFSIFDINDKTGIKNNFKLLSWCNEHKLISQGLIIARENIISLIAERLNEPYLPKHFKENNYSYQLKDIREEIGSILDLLSDSSKDENEFYSKTSDNKFNEIKESIENDFIELVEIYSLIRKRRNDVSHFGISEESSKKYKDIFVSFDEITEKLDQVLEKNDYYLE
ncbi:MAG: TIGR02221 family CRISPR-associated protein [Bacillota bacterium]